MSRNALTPSHRAGLRRKYLYKLSMAGNGEDLERTAMRLARRKMRRRKREKYKREEVEIRCERISVRVAKRQKREKKLFLSHNLSSPRQQNFNKF